MSSNPPVTTDPQTKTEPPAKIDDQWVTFFASAMSKLTGKPPEELRDVVESFGKEATKVGELRASTVTQLKIEKAGGGKLTLATAGTALKLKITALNADNAAVASFVDKVKISSPVALKTGTGDTPAFVAGVLDNYEVTFNVSASSASLVAQLDTITASSNTFPVLPALVKPLASKVNSMAVYNKTERGRNVLAEPPINPGSSALAELRKLRPVGGLNNAPPQSETVFKTIGAKSSDDMENCGAVSLGAICGKTSTQVVEDFLRLKLKDPIREKVLKEKPQLVDKALEEEINKQLESTVNDFKTIQNQSVYWRAENLTNLKYNFDSPTEGMPESAYGEECGESQMAANREMLVAEAKRRNEGGGIGGVKYKVIQDGMNDDTEGLGKFYELKGQELQKQMEKYPDGTQFQVFLNGPTFAGHWIYAEKYNGKVVMEDYQKAQAAQGSRGQPKGATAYTGDDAPHSPKDDSPGVFTRGCFIALCPEDTDEEAVGAWAENPKWPQGGVPSRVVEKEDADDAPDVTAAPESEVKKAIESGEIASKVTDPAFRKGLLAYLDTVSVLSEDLNKKLLAAFRSAPKTDARLREKVFGKVFNCKLKDKNKGKPTAITPEVLNKMADILEQFPQESLPIAWEFNARKGGPFGTFTTGSFDEDGPTKGTAKVEPGLDDTDFTALGKNATDESQALFGAKNFELIVTHEIGHKIDLSKGGKKLTETAACGGWQLVGDKLSIVLDAMPDLVDNFINELELALGKIPATFYGQTKAELKSSILPTNISPEKYAEDSTFRAELAKLLSQSSRLAHPVPSEEAISKAIPGDHALVKIVRQSCRSDPWFHLPNPPVSHGGRVYIMKSDGMWYSFLADSWKNKLSTYQYAAPGEWFAEFYAGVNSSDALIRGKSKSAYPDAHAWMKKEGLLLHPNE